MLTVCNLCVQPDVTAPGLNILAAWSEASSPTKLDGDNRVVKYNIISGTSMSCPHVSATAVLLKSAHPDWSAAAIRSAIMTTGNVCFFSRTSVMPASATSFVLGQVLLFFSLIENATCVLCVSFLQQQRTTRKEAQ